MAKPKSVKAQATRQRQAGVWADVLRSMGIEVPNVGPGSVRRIRERLSADMLADANIRYEQATGRGLPKSAPHNKGRRSESKSTPVSGGAVVQARRVDDIRAALVRAGTLPVALRIEFEGDSRYCAPSTSTVDLGGMEAGSNKGTSGRGRTPLSGPVNVYVGHEDGWPADDVINLIDSYGSTLDALYILWLLQRQNYR